MRFSIIIPVYNVEKYIRRCMASVMEQSFRDFEVIVVDDETPDNSMQIVQEFVDKYPDMIQVIHQKNTRQGGARNRGILEAKGEYILFVDSDDYVHPDMLKTIDARLRENPCDILVFQFAVVTEDGKLLYVRDFDGLSTGMYLPQTDSKIMQLSWEPVNKVYRREFYINSGMRFPENLSYEDAMVRFALAKASSVLLSCDCLYYYVQSVNSTMRSKLTNRVLNIIPVTELVKQTFAEHGLYERNKWELEASLLRGLLTNINLINRKHPFNPMQKAIADYIADSFPEYHSNSCIDINMKKRIRRLVQHRFFLYWIDEVGIPVLKARLIRLALIQKLNELRKTKKS